MVKAHIYECKAKPVTLHTFTSVFNPCCSGQIQVATLGMKMNRKLTKERENLKNLFFMSEVLRQILELITYSKIMQIIILVVN